MDLNGEKGELIVSVIDGNDVKEKENHVQQMDFEVRNDFTGLKKEELIPYLKDPYWVTLRIILLTIFVIIWIAMLVVAIVVIVLTPKCPARPEQHWWQEGVVYSVQVASYLDSDGDGIGDLKGLKSKLGYIKNEVKADTLSVSFLQQEVNEVNPSTLGSFTSITPQLGTIDDFKDLVKAANKMGLKIILELNAFTTSLKHQWYKGYLSKQGAYKDFYLEPNQNVIHGQPNQTLAHPIINLQNSKVLEEIKDAIKYWFGLKVGGIKLEGSKEILALYSSGVLPLKNSSYDDFLEGLVSSWSNAVKEYMDSDKQTLQTTGKVVMADIGIPTNKTLEAKNFQPLNSNLLQFTTTCKTACVIKIVSEWLDYLQGFSFLTNWKLSSTSHEGRVASRVDPLLLNAYSLFLLSLPGSAHVLYGDEIALHDTHIDDTTTAMSIMLWDNEVYRGFSKSPPWLNATLPKDVKDVQTQLALGAGMDTLKVFAKLTSFRKEPALSWGKVDFLQSDDVLILVRSSEGQPCVVSIMNFGSTLSAVSLNQDIIPVKKAKVLSSTYNLNKDQLEHFKDGSEIDLNQAILLNVGQGLLLKCIPEKKWYA